MQETLETQELRPTEALQLIDGWVHDTSTDPLSRGRAIDNLLDLRGLLPQGSPLRIEVDRRLRRMPKARVVDPSWWTETVAHLHALIGKSLPTES